MNIKDLIKKNKGFLKSNSISLKDLGNWAFEKSIRDAELIKFEKDEQIKMIHISSYIVYKNIAEACLSEKQFDKKMKEWVKENK